MTMIDTQPTPDETTSPATPPADPMPGLAEVRDLPCPVDVDALVSQIDTVKLRADHDTREIFVKQKVKEFRAKFTTDGIYVAPQDAEATYRREIERQYDSDRAGEARSLREALADAESQLATLAQDAMRLRREAEVLPKSAPRAESLLARLVDLQGAEAAERRLKGLTVAEIRQRFERTADASDRHLILAVESAIDVGTLTPQNDHEVAELQHLVRLRRERREARVPSQVREALERVQQLRRNAILMAVLAQIEAEGRR